VQSCWNLSALDMEGGYWTGSCFGLEDSLVDPDVPENSSLRDEARDFTGSTADEVRGVCDLDDTLVVAVLECSDSTADGARSLAAALPDDEPPSVDPLVESRLPLVGPGLPLVGPGLPEEDRPLADSALDGGCEFLMLDGEPLISLIDPELGLPEKSTLRDGRLVEPASDGTSDREFSTTDPCCNGPG